MADEINRDDESRHTDEEEELIEEEEEEQEEEEEEEEEEQVEERETRRPRPPYRRGGQSQDSGGGGRSGGGSSYRRGQFRSRRRGCPFCADKTRVIDWKEVDNLRRFVNEAGDMRPRRKTGTCAKHQRRLAQAIKRARVIALLPYTSEHVRLSGSGRR